MFDELAPNAAGVYNWGPDSFVEAITRRVELNEDCTDKPGKLLVGSVLQCLNVLTNYQISGL